MNTRERCERAEAYRKNGANCAQALLAVFADVMGITETQALAVGAGLGGGVRSGNICGAVNAPVMILGCTFPEMAARRRNLRRSPRNTSGGLWRDLSISTAENCWWRRNCSPLTRPWHWRRGITAGCLFSARWRYCAG